MKRKVNIKVKAPQYIVSADVSFAQVDGWCGHTRADLRMDIIHPEDPENRYPCVLWICGGGWQTMDKAAHLAYLSGLARAGFVVASAEYRTANEAVYPAQLEDVKSAVRYLRENAQRFRIDENRIGVMGESAGGYLAAMAALVKDKSFDKGQYMEQSSEVQAACAWYPPSDVTQIPHRDAAEAAASPESLLLGKNAAVYKEDALQICPVSYVSEDAPPFLIIHGTDDHTVPFPQGEILYDKLAAAGCDAELLAIEGADHADVRFFQEEIWDEIISFFRRKL